MKRKTAHICKRCGQCCKMLSPTFTVEEGEHEPRLLTFATPLSRVGNPKTKQFMKERGHHYAIRKPHGRGTSCPLQAPNGECFIHSTRPQICREYPQDSFCWRETQEMKRGHS